MPAEPPLVLPELLDALRRHTPGLLRWAGAIARRLRQFNIALAGKSSGNANTDALTLADITVQELVLAGLRDLDPVFRRCRIEAEEENGDLAAFASESPYVLALDPIDGTRTFRDRTGDGYAVMLHLRDAAHVLYSLVYLPELGPLGTWVQAYGSTIKYGPDDPQIPAAELLDGLPSLPLERDQVSPNIYLIGFQQQDAQRARQVTAAGLRGFASDEMPGAIYPLLCSGAFGGSLIHSPNVYDFPVSSHIVRILGGDAVWVHDGRSVHFNETWLDERAHMLRLPGIVACAIDRASLQKLVELARDWDPRRYTD
ncbi:MAG: inositol monophosphatase family protein [Planctomycetaceae bacterium]